VESFSIKVRVRLSETDALGVVYYGNYFAYFDVSRMELLRSAGLNPGYLTERRLGFVAAESSCRYLSSARFDDYLTLRVWIERVGRSSVTYHHVIMKGRTKVAEGRVTDVMVDREGEPTEIPTEVRKRLRQLEAQA
jgi:acyl-CoA thioester hydrolase